MRFRYQLSLLIPVAMLGRILAIDAAKWPLIFIVAPALALIWFPRQIDDMTFGTWSRGNRINVHTPAFLLAGFGWALLIVEAVVVFSPGFAVRLVAP